MCKFIAKLVHRRGLPSKKFSVIRGGGGLRDCVPQTYINITSYIICPIHGKHGIEIACGSCSLECNTLKGTLPFIVPSFPSVLHAISCRVDHRYRI